MKSISGPVNTMLLSRGHTLAWGMKVQRLDGNISGWSSHTRSKTVTVDGSPLVLVPSNALDMSAISKSAGFGVDNLEVTVLQTDDDVMTKVQLLEGLWDHAAFALFQFDWATPANAIIPHMWGTFGNATPRLGSFVIELRCLRQFLQQDTTRRTQPNCDYDFGDPNTCTVDLGPRTHNGTVTSVVNGYSFTASAFAPAAGAIDEGRINWLTGANAGRSQKVRTHATGGVFTLVLPMVRAIAIGDTFQAIEGCPRTRQACIDRGNVLNFPGFDQKPTVDELTGGSTVAS